MINKIELLTIPFNNERQLLDELKTFNYFFGGNGSGKTTISKVIAAHDKYPNCNITWANGISLETRVYNRDFVERNFNPQSELKGVFTLGEMEADTLEKMQSTKTNITKLTEDIKSFQITLNGANGDGGKKAELEKLKTTYRDKFWIQKRKKQKTLSEGLRGYLNDSTKFMDKVLFESSNNKATLLPHAELEEKSMTIFSKTITPATHIPVINTSSILLHEKNPILQKHIIGKDDVDISAMIKKLGNSDWVREGITYYENNEGTCPFCQQETKKNFEKNLNEYYDESFSQDITAVNKLVNDYVIDAKHLQQQIEDLINIKSEFLDNEKLKSENQILDSVITINNERLIKKQKETSQAITLDSLEDILIRITAFITKANKDIEERNTIIKNIKSEKEILTKQIWRFIVEELSSEIIHYNTEKKNLETAINSLKLQMEAKGIEKKRKESELQELEKKTTSIHPTLKGIDARCSG